MVQNQNRKCYMDQNLETYTITNTTVTNDVEDSSMSLKHYGLIFGAMEELKIAEIFDEIIPKWSHNFNVSHGQVAKCVIACLVSKGENKCICNIGKFAAKIPVAALFNNHDLQYTDFNEYVEGELLDAIAKFGVTQFSALVFSKIAKIEGFAEKVIKAHIDATSRQVFRISYTDKQIEQLKEDKRTKAVNAKDDAYESDKQVTAIKFGYSRDGDGSYPQVNIIHITTDPSDVGATYPILSSICSGNNNDIKEFGNVFTDVLSDFKKNYPNLRYVIGDSALASPRSVAILRKYDLHILSRLSDNRVREQLQQAANGSLPFESVDINGNEIKVAWAGTTTFDDPDTGESWVGKLLAVSSPNMRPSKQRKHEHKAADEEKAIKRETKTLNKSKFNCQADAEKAAKELISKLKYHSAQINIKEHKSYIKAGRPSPNSEFIFKYTFELTLSLDQDKIQRMVDEESFYVLVTTDLDSNQSARDMVLTYHGQYHIERTWKDVKTKGMYVDAIHLKNPQRIRALLFLQSLALFVVNYLLSKIHAFLKESDTCLQSCKSYKTSSPKWETLIDTISNLNLNLMCDFNTHKVKIPGVKTSLFFMKLLQYLGAQYSKFYNVQYYRLFYAQIADQCYNVVTENNRAYQNLELREYDIRCG